MSKSPTPKRQTRASKKTVTSVPDKRACNPCVGSQAVHKPYRVFISYNHANVDWMEILIEHLYSIGVFPVVDHQIRIGEPFADEIKEMIECSHVFMPLITSAANKRLWVQQEIGYASALHVPYCPIWFDDQKKGGGTSGMAGQIQGIVVPFDICHSQDKKGLFRTLLKDRLNYEVIDSIVDSAQHQMARVKQAGNFLDRQQLLIGLTKSAGRDSCRLLCGKRIPESIQLDKSAWKLRISAAYGSFSIPDVCLSHPIWAERDPGRFQSTSERALLRSERQLLENYAQRFGCDLFIDPWAPAREKNGTEMKHPPLQRAIRIQLLIDFIKGKNSDKTRVIVVDKTNICLRNTNLIILGDWFSAEAVVPISAPGGYEHTTFTRHAPTVLKEIDGFDRFFNDYIEEGSEEWPTAKFNEKALTALHDMLVDALREVADKEQIKKVWEEMPKWQLPPRI